VDNIAKAIPDLAQHPLMVVMIAYK